MCTYPFIAWIYTYVCKRIPQTKNSYFFFQNVFLQVRHIKCPLLWLYNFQKEYTYVLKLDVCNIIAKVKNGNSFL